MIRTKKALEIGEDYGAALEETGSGISVGGSMMVKGIITGRMQVHHKDFLVINQKDGHFYNFCWYSAKKHRLKTIQAQIVKFNQSDLREKDGLTAELITDPLIREICAYIHNCRPFHEIITKTKEIQTRIDAIYHSLEEAQYELSKIEELEG